MWFRSFFFGSIEIQTLLKYVSSLFLTLFYIIDHWPCLLSATADTMGRNLPKNCRDWHADLTRCATVRANKRARLNKKDHNEWM